MLALASSHLLRSPRGRKADARDQFEQAVRMRTSLEGYLPRDRSLSDYKQTVAAYHKVYAISPGAEEASPALIAEGELYEAMGQPIRSEIFSVRYRSLQIPAAAISR